MEFCLFTAGSSSFKSRASSENECKTNLSKQTLFSCS